MNSTAYIKVLELVAVVVVLLNRKTMFNREGSVTELLALQEDHA